MDIVKAKQNDLTMMNELAKRMSCAMGIIHHSSKGSAALDWSDQAAGTFAMSAATEAQIHVSRFKELDINAPERLVRAGPRTSASLSPSPYATPPSANNSSIVASRPSFQTSLNQRRTRALLVSVMI
jgi:hypothetical protein